MASVRARFAPSPTGHLHVGNARTALFNWLFARQQGGVFILRVEDTDLERSEARFEGQLLEDLKWLGLEWDEGPDKGGPHIPYRQSDRWKLYEDTATRLLAEDKAYLCFCTAEELEQERQSALSEGRQPIYSGKCRKLDPAEAQRRRAGGEPAAIRLMIPEHPIRFTDIVHGAVEFSNEVVSDPIIVRSTGVPVYNYVVVVDDIEMRITHVIRGDDHLSNTPRQVALYEALGARPPQFAHLSTILGSDRERLSKRHGATSIANFRDMGILPEALMNYLALLGWAPTGGDREIFSPAELVKEFDLRRVTPSPAVFDFDKLYWLNRHYIKQADPERVLDLAIQFFVEEGLVHEHPHAQKREWLAKVVALFAPSVDRLDQIPKRAGMIYHFDPLKALEAPDNQELLQLPTTPAVMDSFASKVRAGNAEMPLTPERFKALINEVKTATGTKGKELFHPIRMMLTGSHSGPDFDKLVPILEQGSRLNLSHHVMGVRERVEAFQRARTQSLRA